MALMLMKLETSTPFMSSCRDCRTIPNIYLRGNTNQNRAPWPGSLFTPICPP